MGCRKLDILDKNQHGLKVVHKASAVKLKRCADAWRWEYYIKDHLDNIRISFSDLNDDGEITVALDETNEILEENHYYPFGMKLNGPWLKRKNQGFKNKYTYNGKEEMPFTGYLDFTGRTYDPAIGRMIQSDPLAAETPSTSSYAFGFNSPIMYSDPTGFSAEICPTCPEEPQFDEYRDLEESYTYLGNNTVVNESTGSTSEVIEPAAQDNTQVNQQLEGEGSEKTQGGLHLVDPHKSGDQVGALPTGDNADIVESLKTIKYTGASNPWTKAMELAKGHFDVSQSGAISYGVDGVVGAVKGKKVKGGSMLTLVSQEGDTITHIVRSANGKPVDTTSSVAFRPKNILRQSFKNIRLQPTNKMVKNPKK